MNPDQWPKVFLVETRLMTCRSGSCDSPVKEEMNLSICRIIC